MKTSIYIGTSLDGYIARNDGDLDWLTPYANYEAVHAYEEFMNGIDAIVIGRGTFEKVLTFPSWPYDKKVFVLSHSIKKVPIEFNDKVTLLSMKPKELLAYLSDLGNTSLYIDGGKVIQSFLKNDLIDQMIISKAPILLGKGIPLFSSLGAELEFNHKKTLMLSNGLVISYYERNRS